MFAELEITLKKKRVTLDLCCDADISLEICEISKKLKCMYNLILRLKIIMDDFFKKIFIFL